MKSTLLPTIWILISASSNQAQTNTTEYTELITNSPFKEAPERTTNRTRFQIRAIYNRGTKQHFGLYDTIREKSRWQTKDEKKHGVKITRYNKTNKELQLQDETTDYIATFPQANS